VSLAAGGLLGLAVAVRHRLAQTHTHTTTAHNEQLLNVR